MRGELPYWVYDLVHSASDSFYGATDDYSGGGFGDNGYRPLGLFAGQWIAWVLDVVVRFRYEKQRKRITKSWAKLG